MICKKCPSQVPLKTSQFPMTEVNVGIIQNLDGNVNGMFCIGTYCISLLLPNVMVFRQSFFLVLIEVEMLRRLKYHRPVTTYKAYKAQKNIGQHLINRINLLAAYLHTFEKQHSIEINWVLTANTCQPLWSIYFSGNCG